MTAFGEVIYNITNMYVATPLGGGVFGPPAHVDLLSMFSYQFAADDDQIKAYGLVVELLTINTHIEGEIQQASIDAVVHQILTGEDSSSSGTTPDRVVTADALVGGAGLPYFAWIAEYASLDGARFVAGAAKCKLDVRPGFQADQNKFRIGQAGLKMIAPSTTARIALRTKRIEGAYTFPTDAAGFATFFSGFYS